MFEVFDFSDDFAPLSSEEEEESQLVRLDPDPPQHIRRAAPKEYAFDSFVQQQLEGYIKRERQEAKIKVGILEEQVSRSKAELRAAGEAKASRAGALQNLEATYLQRQQAELERQRDIMLGLRRDQNIRNLQKAKKAKEEEEKKKRGKRR